MPLLPSSRKESELKVLERAAQITQVFIRHGLEDLFDQAHLSDYFRGKRPSVPDERPEKPRSRAESLRAAFEELGPTFMKIGQILTMRPDILPDEYTDELRKLEDQAPPFDFQSVKDRLCDGLGKGIDEIFEEFDPVPIAAASLSQVHRARLKTGESVAVKVQRPGIRETIEEDFRVLTKVVKLLQDQFKEEIPYDATDILSEFSDAVVQELDFMNEARNMERFRENFSDSDLVSAPKVHWEFTCNTVVTMDYIRGTKISEVFLSEKGEGCDRKKIARIGIESTLKQILEDRFFHADPHPGNLMVLRDNTICFLDFGRVGYIDEGTSRDLLDLMNGILNREADDVSSSLMRMGIVGTPSQSEEIKSDIEGILARYYGMEVGDIWTSDLIRDLLDMMREHEMRIPKNLTLLFHTIMTIEGVSSRLYPDIVLLEEAKPFIRRMMLRRLSPFAIFKRFRRPISKTLRLLENLPDDIELALNRLRSSDFEVGLRLEGLEELITELDTASNRISVSLIISALIVGSSLVVQSNLGPFIEGYPLLGILGYGVASVLGIAVVISILRKGNF